MKLTKLDSASVIAIRECMAVKRNENIEKLFKEIGSMLYKMLNPKN